MAMDINKELEKLHELLLKYEPIDAIYNTKTHRILEIENFVNVDWEQLKVNFFGTIDYLYRNYCANSLYEGLDMDISDEIYDIHENFEFFKETKYDRLILVKTYLLLLLFSLTAKKESNLDALLKSDYSLQEHFEKDKWYFRGELDFSWDFIPSMIRKVNFPDGVSILDENKVFDLLQKNGFDKKYKKVFGNDKPYDYLSFAQHSISFSPYLDFSSSHYVALSFACERRKMNGSIYALKPNFNANSQKEKEPRNIVIVRNKKLDVYTFIGDKEIYNCAYFDFEPKTRIYETRTNDRMRYQKGVFLDIYRGIFVNNKLLFPIGSENIIKFKIEGNKKRLGKTKIYKFIKESYPQYELKLLYKPYDFFKYED